MSRTVERMDTETDEISDDQFIDGQIQETAFFLKEYLQATDEGPLNAEEVNDIRMFIAVVAINGSKQQQQQLYFILLNARAQLGAMQLPNLQQPLTELTHFFQQKCPAETNEVDDELRAMAPQHHFRNGAASAA